MDGYMPKRMALVILLVLASCARNSLDEPTTYTTKDVTDARHEGEQTGLMTGFLLGFTHGCSMFGRGSKRWSHVQVSYDASTLQEACAELALKEWRKSH